MSSDPTTASGDAFRQGQRLHQLGRLAEARACYDAAIRHNPHHAEALHLAGVIGFQTGQLEQGIALVRQAIALRPDAAPAHANLGQALNGLGRYAEAAEALRRAIALQPAAARAHAALGAALLALGDAQAALASGEAALALQPALAEAHNLRGLALHRLARADEALASFDQAIRLTPADPAPYVNAANTLSDAGRWDEALARLDGALRLNPGAPEALASRAAVLSQLNRPEHALQDLTRAARLRPNLAGVRYNLGALLKDLRRPAEALAQLDAAIALDPGHPASHFSRGAALAELRRWPEALAAYNQAVALKPGYAEAIYSRGLMRLKLGDFVQGQRDFEARKALTPPLGLRPCPGPEWRGEGDIAGKALFLHHEQGLGDTLMFSRYALLAEARGATVALSVQAPLRRLMRSLSPTIPVLGEDERPEHMDLHAPLMSLPLAFGTAPDTIPASPRYLAPDPDLRALWATRLPATGRRRIGLVWAANRENLALTHRSAGLEAMRPLLAAEADWICLQKDAAPEEAAAFTAVGGTRLPEPLRDFADTAAVVDLLDLVITVDTSVAHLAGALGRPVFILLAHHADWRWLLGRTDSPWYPSARLFRQPAPGDWRSVMAEVDAVLAGAQP